MKSLRQLTIELIYASLTFLIILFLCLIITYDQLRWTPILYVTFLIALILTVIVSYVLFSIYKAKGIKRYIDRLMILKKFDESFISIGAYKKINDYLAITPNVDINRDNIKIHISNIHIRAKLESYQDYFSSILPEEFIVIKTYLDRSQNALILDFNNIKENGRMIFKSFNDYRLFIDKLPYSKLYLDNKNTIDIVDYNGFLITGQSGSGKSYFAQQIIIQALLKEWTVNIIDYKRSYQAFKRKCNVAFTIDEIKTTLQNAINELHERQKAMDEILENDPRALAIDAGFPIYLVVIEEYLALVNSGIPKKELDVIEKQILELTTVGRALNITLAMILQVSSAQALNTSIRANLPVKIVFGNANRTILETTFGIGNIPKVQTKLEKGEGYATLDSDIFTFASPTLEFNTTECIKDIVACCQ